MKHRQSQVALTLTLIAVLLSSVLLGYKMPSALADSAQAKTVTLTYWWWGESDVTGIDKWMRQTIQLFHKAHPNINVSLQIQSTDNLISNFQAAASAHHGPDLATQWATIPVLSQAWANAVVPVSNYIPKSEIKNWVSTPENSYNGKIWGMPLYLIGIPLAYNKTLFRKAGLNPNKPPRTFNELLKDSAVLKKHGIIPFALGNKDGYGGAWFWSTMGKGELNSVRDLLSAVVGKSKFTDTKFTAWLAALQTMVQNGYINNDVASLDLNNGFTPFVQGKAAMTLSTDTNILRYAKQLGKNVVGITLPPQIGSARLSHYYDTTQSSSEMITSWSRHKKEAAMFLMFMHRPDRLKALYQETGAFPADKRFNLRAIKDPMQHQMIKWDLTLPSVWLENFVPTQIDLNGDQTAGEMITSKNGTPQTAGQIWERTAAAWRQSNVSERQHFEAWLRTVK